MREPNDFSDLPLEDAERLAASIPDDEVEPGPPTDDMGDAEVDEVDEDG
jgi:hypothetical protein